MNYDYPFIDKDYYPAVMFAEKMIRDGEYFGLAAYKAARYYGVDKDAVQRYLSERQRIRTAARPYKKPSASKGKRYYWFVVEAGEGNDAGNYQINEVFVVRGLTKDSVENRYEKYDHEKTRDCDTGSAYSPYFFHRATGPFNTEADAKDAAKTFKTGCL